MGRRKVPANPGTLFHVILRAHGKGLLVSDDEDWQALSAIVTRMLFWCGGRVYSFRCEGKEVHAGLEIARTTVGTMCRRISVPYALHLRRRWGRAGPIFKPYVAIPIEVTP